MPSSLDSLGRTAQRIRDGDREALAHAFLAHRPRLARIIEFRLDARLAARVSTEDVLQESFLQASDRCTHLKGDTAAAVFLWLRLIVLQTMTNLYRRHLGAGMRDARRERGSDAGAAMTAALLASLTSPTEGIRRAEQTQMLHSALQELSDLDREVLALRHFEELENHEVAAALEIEPKAASIRYFRALKRLKTRLDELGLNSQAGSGG